MAARKSKAPKSLPQDLGSGGITAGSFEDDPSPRQATRPFPIVGIGASAGGLEAFTQLLNALPVDTGMAFVLVQHLAPTHASMLAEILSRHRDAGHGGHDSWPSSRTTSTSFRRADMVIVAGTLQLCPAGRPRAAPAHRSVPPLPGGGPGPPGHRRDPLGHRHRRHPGAGGDQGRGRHHLRPGRHGPAREHAAQRHRRGLRGFRAASRRDRRARSPASAATPTWRRMRRATARPRQRAEPGSDPRQLRRATGVDFTHYKIKPSTAASPAAWSCTSWTGSRTMCLPPEQPRRGGGPLPGHPHQRHELLPRPEAFEALKSKVFPRLLKNRSRHEPVRIWGLGCSTGEEAYSSRCLRRVRRARAGRSRSRSSPPT